MVFHLSWCGSFQASWRFLLQSFRLASLFLPGCEMQINWASSQIDGSLPYRERDRNDRRNWGALGGVKVPGQISPPTFYKPHMTWDQLHGLSGTVGPPASHAHTSNAATAFQWPMSTPPVGCPPGSALGPPVETSEASRRGMQQSYCPTSRLVFPSDLSTIAHLQRYKTLLIWEMSFGVTGKCFIELVAKQGYFLSNFSFFFANHRNGGRPIPENYLSGTFGKVIREECLEQPPNVGMMKMVDLPWETQIQAHSEPEKFAGWFWAS